MYWSLQKKKSSSIRDKNHKFLKSNENSETITQPLTGSTSHERNIGLWPTSEPQSVRPKTIPIHKVCLGHHSTLHRPNSEFAAFKTNAEKKVKIN
jgi:hypothetical protein